MIKGIIFDVDGTTLNTLNDLYFSFNQALKDFGLPPQSMDQVRMGVGRGFRMLVEKCTPETTDEETKTKLGVHYRQIYAQNYLKTTKPYEGMTETLEKLQEKGIRMGVNSNKSDVFVKGLIEKNFPQIAFTEVMGAREGIPHKPDPAGTNLIIEKMGVEKSEVLYVGDSDTDMKTAGNAGVTAVGCLWGFRDRETLLEGGADILIEKPFDLLEHLGP